MATIRSKMPEIVELRQERALVSDNFDGYKLSLDRLPLLRQELTTAALRAEPNDEQYSLLHAELFSMQNLLQPDPWWRAGAYFVNQKRQVVRCAYDENTGRPLPQTVVYLIPSDMCNERRKGDYNYSFRFVSEKYCVLCDGIKHIFLLDTGDRQKANEWKLLTQCAVVDAEQMLRNFIIYDCRLDIIQEQKQISLALGHIERVEAEAAGSSHYMHIYLAQWVYKDAWLFQHLDVLEGKGSIYYCAFEPRAASLIVCSNRDYEFRSNKAKVITNIKPTAEEAKPQLHGEAQFNYSWSQTAEDITIKLNTNTVNNIKDCTIISAAEELTVQLLGVLQLEISLFDKVDKDLTTWTLANDCLQITLIKATPDFSWPFLLKDGGGPAECNEKDGSTAEEERQPIANLEAPIEECDFPMGAFDNDVKIVRFHIATKEATHAILLGSNPPLFFTNLRPGFPNAIATRFDVDASLWIVQYNPSKPDNWNLRHEGNLHAFGYVQASKQQKKFVDCAPDLSYSIICESHKHIFLYKAKHDTANGLRNRNGPQVTIGKQHLITLDDAGEVLGLSTASNFVIILTEKCVLYLQIN